MGLYGELKLQTLDDRRCAMMCRSGGKLRQLGVVCGFPEFELDSSKNSIISPFFVFTFDSTYEFGVFSRVVSDVKRYFGMMMLKESLEKDIGIEVDELSDFSSSSKILPKDALDLDLGASPPSHVPLNSSAQTAAALAAAAARARSEALMRSCSGLSMPLSDFFLLENALPSGAMLRAPLIPTVVSPTHASLALASGSPALMPGSALPAPASAMRGTLCVLQPVDAITESGCVPTNLRALAVEFCEKYIPSGNLHQTLLYTFPFLTGFEIWCCETASAQVEIERALAEARNLSLKSTESTEGSGGVAGSPRIFPLSTFTLGDVSSSRSSTKNSSATSFSPTSSSTSYHTALQIKSNTHRKRCSLCDALAATSSKRRNQVAIHALCPILPDNSPLWACEACWELIMIRRRASLLRGTLVGPDGSEELCAMCAQGMSREGLKEGDLILCSAKRCPRSYCKDCLRLVLYPTRAGFNEVVGSGEWLCPPCACASSGKLLLLEEKDKPKGKEKGGMMGSPPCPPVNANNYSPVNPGNLTTAAQVSKSPSAAVRGKRKDSVPRQSGEDRPFPHPSFPANLLVPFSSSSSPGKLSAGGKVGCPDPLTVNDLHGDEEGWEGVEEEAVEDGEVGGAALTTREGGWRNALLLLALKTLRNLL